MSRDPGQYNTPVSIISDAEFGAETRLGGYERAAPLDVVALAWAKVVPNSTGRFRVAGMDQGQVTHIVYLNEWFDAVKKGMTVLVGTRRLSIIGPPTDADGTRNEMTLLTKELVTSG